MVSGKFDQLQKEFITERKVIQAFVDVVLDLGNVLLDGMLSLTTSSSELRELKNDCQLAYCYKNKI
jgi:hypothetical protein